MAARYRFIFRLCLEVFSCFSKFIAKRRRFLLKAGEFFKDISIRFRVLTGRV